MTTCGIHGDDTSSGRCATCDAQRSARQIREEQQARVGAWMTRGLGPMHPEDPGDAFTCPRCGRTSHHPDDIREGYCGACHDWTGRDGDEQPDECGAQLVTPGPDPYATSCDQPPGHYPASKHDGDDPIFPGPGMRVRWQGGGSCAGDPLPFRDVEWTDGKGGWRS